MKNLSKLKPIYRYLIMISIVISFIVAYTVFSFGLFYTENTAMSVAYVFMIGLIAYLIFELVLSLVYMLLLRFVPDFALSKTEFKLQMRVFIIFRNVVYGLINVIFIYYPVASVWGILINYVLTTTICMLLFYFNLKRNYDIAKNNYFYLTRMVTIYSAYLVIYLLVGSLV